MVFEVKTKKWGNSIGVIIPNEAVLNFNLKPDEKILVEIKEKENILRELFGSLKFKSTRKVIRDVREDLGSKWLG